MIASLGLIVLVLALAAWPRVREYRRERWRLMHIAPIFGVKPRLFESNVSLRKRMHEALRMPRSTEGYRW